MPKARPAMDPNSAVNTYRDRSIETAPPVKIVRLLYEGALRYIERARRQDPADPSSDFLFWIRRAEDIVSELRMSLERERAPALCDTLERLYLFVESQLGEAAGERAIEPLEGARKVLATLLEAWSALEVEEVGGEGGPPA